MEQFHHISIQVLHELFVTLTRLGQSDKTATEVIEDYLAWNVIHNTADILLRGIEFKKRWKVSFWDAMILSAAHQANACVLLTEDLHQGQVYGTVKAVNPLL